jgi:hypothetical protein
MPKGSLRGSRPEFHELAAHPPHVAAGRPDKEGHLTGHQHSQQAMEHSAKP